VGDIGPTVEAVCRLPIDFHTLGDVSPVELVRRSGYRGQEGQVTVDVIADCLAKHNDWVEAWFVWSDDQRFSPAWWLNARSPSGYEVGYYDPKLARQAKPSFFEDKVSACAEFVIRVIAQLDALEGA
jgi:hypothetical protein